MSFQNLLKRCQALFEEFPIDPTHSHTIDGASSLADPSTSAKHAEKQKKSSKKRQRKRPLCILNKLKDGLQLIGTNDNLLVVSLKRIYLECPPHTSDESVPAGVPEQSWRQRHALFSKFDEGIQLDSESWYSVTHEVVAEHIAKVCKNATRLVDAFCGVGGNTVQLARFAPVTAVDIDQNKLDMLKHNAEIYGVAAAVDCKCMDFLQFEAETEVDAVFGSPPWGGPGYKKKRVFDLHMLQPPITEILQKMSTLSSNIILYLPKTVDPSQFLEVFPLLPTLQRKIEFHLIYLNGKATALCCFIGQLVHPDSDKLASLLLLRFPPGGLYQRIELSQQLDTEELNDVLVQLNERVT